MTVLEIMFTSYPNAQVNEKLLANYLRHFDDVPVEVLQEACDRCVRECKFAPTIADIVERLPNRYKAGPMGEYRAPGSKHLTLKEINELPAPTKLYRDPNDTPGPEGRRYRVLQMTQRDRGDDRGH